MKISRRPLTTVMLATLALSLGLLAAAQFSNAQVTAVPKDASAQGLNDMNSGAVANSPEPASALPAMPSAVANSSEPASATPAMPRAAAASDPNSGFHVALVPYLWMSGLNGTVGARGHETSVHASFGDVVSNLNFGIMALADMRYNRIVMPVDFMWMKLSDLRGLPFEEGTTSVKGTLNEDILTPKIGYRVIDKERFKIDGLVGFRYWHIGTTVNLQSNTASASFYQPANWVDAVGGARIEAMLTPKVILTIAGDAGGGGANSDYQVGAGLGFKLKKVVLQAGWRYMSVNYRPSNGVISDIAMSGLILGVVIPLK